MRTRKFTLKIDWPLSMIMVQKVVCYSVIILELKNGILLPKLFWPSVRTVKGQNNFCKQNTFLNCSWRFLRYQEKLKKTMYCPKMRLCNCKICLVCTCIPYVHTVYFFCTICTQGVRVLTGGQAASHSSSLFLFSYTRLLSGFIAFLKTNFNLLLCNVKFHIFF